MAKVTKKSGSKKPLMEDAAQLKTDLGKISKDVKKLLDEGISRKAVVALIHDTTRVKKKLVEKVLDGMLNLEDYLAPKMSEATKAAVKKVTGKIHNELEEGFVEVKKGKGKKKK